VSFYFLAASPTYDPAPPVLAVSLATKTRSTIVLSVTYPHAYYAGTIYCAAFAAGFTPPATGFSDLVVTSGVSAAYAVNSTSASLTVAGLFSVETYDTYCSAVNAFGTASTSTNVLSTLLQTTTSCCKQITFTKNPTFLYGDTSKYTAATLPTFQYALSSAPASQVKITPTVYNSTGDKVPASVVAVTPAVAVFQRNSSLSTSFFLSASASVSGTFTISLVASATNAADYETNVYKMTTLLNNTAKVPAPALLNAKFANSGASIVVTFDSVTNKAEIKTTSFACSKLFDFAGVNQTTCSFTSLSAVNIAFNYVPYGTAQLSVNGQITLRANKIKAACPTLTGCGGYAFSNKQSTTVLTADSPVAPTAVLRSVATASACDPYTIDPTMSTGSGGRSWKSVTWTATIQTLGSPATDVPILDLLTSYGPVTSSKINIDQALLSSANYAVTLTVVNMFDLSSTASIAWSVNDNPNLPLVSIAGPSVVDLIPSDILSLTTSSARASCAVGTSALTYSWTVSSGGSVVSSVHSTSASPSKLLLPAYTLSTQTLYTVTFTALAAATTTPAAYPAISASASVTVRVGKGTIVAVVPGGSFRSLSAQAGNLTLDASTSYDQSYPRGSVVVGQTLSFHWSCRTVSAATYGASCADKLPLVSNAAQLRVVSSVLSFGELYEFTVTASASDGRSNSYAVTVQNSAGSTYTAITNAVLTKVNPSSALVLTGAVRAGYAVDASWSALVDGMAQTFTANTPLSTTFSGRQVKSLLSYPLSVPANTFAAGSVVTFRLFASRAGNATQFTSTAELVITMNSPPSGGVVTVDPATGDAMADLFSVVALSWTDDVSDYPLAYEFAYRLTVSQAAMTVQSKSSSNSFATTLPAGLATLGHQVTLIGRVYDSFLASSTATTSAVVNVVEGFDVGGYVNDQVANALLTGDTDQLSQIVANAATAVNAVNCTAASQALCDSLNRNQCFATPQKCSACLDGYTGLEGDRNTMCRNDGAVLGATGDACTTNDDCALGLCTNSVCAVPVLECPSFSTDVCSGRGQCMYTNSNNKYYGRTCLITDTDCAATCKCEDGFGGSACQLSANDVVERGQTRGALCRAIITLSSSQDLSSFLLDSLITALYNAYDPAEVLGNEPKSVCYQALSLLADFSAQGYLSVQSQSRVIDVTSKFVLDAASTAASVGAGGRRLDEALEAALNSSSVVDSAISSIVTGILDSMADGQEPVLYSNNQVNVIVYKSLAGNLTELAPPQDDAGTSIELAGLQVADTLQSDSGYLEASALLWLTNPFPNSTDLESALFRLEVYGDFGSSRRTQESVRNGTEAAFYLTTQFTVEQDFNFTLSLDDAVRLGPSNFTIPQCSYYVGAEYKRCEGCWVDTYTNYNVTYGCPLAAIYDLSGTENRLLQASSGSQTTQFASTLTTVDERIFNPFNNSFDIDWGTAKIVLAFLSTLTFIIIVGFIFFVHTDYVESHIVALYAAEGKQVGEKEAVVAAGASSATATQAAAGSSPRGSAKVEYDDVFESTSSAKQQFVQKEVYVTNVVASFLDSVMPEESLQKASDASWASFLATMLKHHKYSAILFGSSVKFPRTLRWASITMAFLLNIFFTTVFFGVFYPDDGTCQDRTGEDNCLSSDSSATNTNLCVWNVDPVTGDGACGLNDPPRRFVYLITVVIVIVVISAPFIVLYDYVLFNWCVRRPRFEEWGYTTPAAPVSATVDNKAAPIQALYQRRNANRVPVTSSEARVQYVLDADNFTADQVYDTQMSVADESRQILQESQDYLQNHANAPQLAWQNGKYNSAKQAKANAIQQHIGINADGTPVPLNVFEKIAYGTPHQKLVSSLTKARVDADVIEQRLKACGSEVQAKDALLIQHFILEQFSPIKQFVLRRHMFNNNMTTQMTVSPLVWVLAWTWVILSMAFFLAWAFAWGATEGGNTAAAWGIVIGTALAQDVLIIQVFRVYVIYSLSMVSIKPQLQYIYRVLNKVAISFAQDEIADNFLDVRVCQHLSPACRAAHSHIAHDLATATILRHIDDADVSMCRVKHEVHLATLAAVVLAVPVAFAIISETLGSIVLEALLPAFFDAVLIMNRYFWSGAGFFILLPYLLFIVVYLWYTRVHKPAHQQLNAHKRGETSDESVKRWQTAERGAKGRGFFASASENCMAAAFYVSRPALIVQAASDAWFGVYDPVYDAQWSAMNRPVYLQALVSQSPEAFGTTRAERLVEKESEQAMQEVLKRRIPDEVSDLLVASKTHWLEAWTNRHEDAVVTTDPALPPADPRYVLSMMSYRLNHVHRGGPAPRAPYQVEHDGITHSPRALEYAERHGAVLTAEEAVAHILRNYRKYVSMGRMALVDAEESNDLYAKEAAACDVLIEFFDLRILLEEALSVYQPLGQALSHEEKDEIVDSCYAWLVQHGDAFLESHYNHDTNRIAAATLARINHSQAADSGAVQATNFSVPFQQFRRWFLSTGTAVTRYRQQQQQQQSAEDGRVEA